MDFNLFKDCEDLKKNISSIVFWTFATFDMSNHACKNLNGMPALTCIVFFFLFCGESRKLRLCGSSGYDTK